MDEIEIHTDEFNHILFDIEVCSPHYPVSQFVPVSDTSCCPQGLLHKLSNTQVEDERRRLLDSVDGKWRQLENTRTSCEIELRALTGPNKAMWRVKYDQLKRR